jgi:muramoyltetrapeptide carboxypeptidase
MQTGVSTRGRIIKSKAVKPQRLGSGSVIGIAAPAGAFETGTLKAGTAVLRAMGFNVVIPEDICASERYLAGTDVHRAEVIHHLFADPGIDAVMCARGGYGSLRILPLLDYVLISNHPKVLIGFSDITALLTVVSMRCGMVVFHGPMVTSLGNASERTLAGLQEAVASHRPVWVSSDNGRVIRPGTAIGKLCGGNLTTLCHLLGTPFAPRFRKCIVFLEDCGEAPYRIDRMLVHMKAAGCFNAVSGLVLGSFQNCGTSEEIAEIVEDVFQETVFPILAGLDVGHTDPNLTLPFGVHAKLDTECRSLICECGTAG